MVSVPPQTVVVAVGGRAGPAEGSTAVPDRGFMAVYSQALSFLRLIHVVRQTKARAGCAPIPLHPGFLTPYRGSSFGPFSCVRVVVASPCWELGCRAGRQPEPAMRLPCSLLYLHCSQTSPWCRVLQSSFTALNRLAEPGWSSGAQRVPPAPWGCATSLALALLVPQSCRFQVALRRGKDNPQGCLQAAHQE